MGGFKEWVDGLSVCEVWADRWVEGEGKGLVYGAVTYEAKKRGKICFVIYIAGKRIFFYL